MSMKPITVRSVATLALVSGGALFMIAKGLPWLAEKGYAGRVIQENIRHDRDATALFYTESARTWEVLHATSGENRNFHRRMAVEQP